jgi:hypothetical protein
MNLVLQTCHFLGIFLGRTTVSLVEHVARGSQHIVPALHHCVAQGWPQWENQQTLFTSDCHPILTPVLCTSCCPQGQLSHSLMEKL